MLTLSMAQADTSDRTASKDNNAFMSSWDPRHLNRTQYPHARNAMVLAATLHPGDALYIPVSWWHYIEAGVEAGLSVGVNAFAYAHRAAGDNASKKAML